MDDNLKKAIFNAVENEPFAKVFDIKLIELDTGFSAVEMIYEPNYLRFFQSRFEILEK